MENSYFVGWGTLAFINAGIAQGKNRSGLNWFRPIATVSLSYIREKKRFRVK
ncbi:hypothetical protein [Psychrobacillus psychrodurans]|uniref:hypothetical protein n=1 Tax=Psychrobacillus psychrodurans TaxID=126157 RepID=UPI003D0411B2